MYDNYSANLLHEGRLVNLLLWDTAGQEDYDRIRALSYPGTHSFLVAFSVMSRASFNNVKHKWLPELRYHCPNAPILLVGTKSDMRVDASALHQLQQRGESPVSLEEMQALAKIEGLAGAMECSARTQEHARHVFDELVRSGLKAQIPPVAPSACLDSGCSIM